MIAMFPCLEIRPGAMGKASPGWHLELHDDDGKPVPADMPGRIAVNLNPRPVGLFQGYIDSPESNGESFQNGYYYTGDRAIRDADGYFWFLGRTDDVIKSSGYRIGPLEVENAVMEHPAVKETAVIGVPDNLRGEVVKAYVILKEGHAPSNDLAREIQQVVKNSTAPYKYPRLIEFVDSLPKTYSGKIQRKLLRTHALEQMGKG
jgi:acetyl-CoA synthetase